MMNVKRGDSTLTGEDSRVIVVEVDCAAAAVVYTARAIIFRDVKLFLLYQK